MHVAANFVSWLTCYDFVAHLIARGEIQQEGNINKQVGKPPAIILNALDHTVGPLRTGCPACFSRERLVMRLILSIIMLNVLL